MSVLMGAVRQARIALIVVGILGLTTGMAWGLLDQPARKQPVRTKRANPPGKAGNPVDQESVAPSPSCHEPTEVLLVEVQPPERSSQTLVGLFERSAQTIYLPFDGEEIQKQMSALLTEAESADLVVLLLRLNPGETQMEIVELLLEQGSDLLALVGGDPVSVAEIRDLLGPDVYQLQSVRDAADDLSPNDEFAAGDWLTKKICTFDSSN